MTEKLLNRFGIFRDLHLQHDLLILPNVWDALSAALFERAGAKALTTTSAGISWSAGYADGEELPLEELQRVVQNILRVIHIPLSIDFESGYSNDPKMVARNLFPFLEAGIAGIDIEDGIYAPEILVPKIRAIRKLAILMKADLFINIRCDVFVREIGGIGERLAEVLRRAKMYEEAGADGLFLPSLTDKKIIREIVRKTGLHVNLMVWRGLPGRKTLEKLGVSRITPGAAFPKTMWAHGDRLIHRFLKDASSGALTRDSLLHTTLQGLF